MDRSRLLREAIRTGPPLVLDAAMGTRLITRGLDLRTDDPSLWTLSNPEIVREIHRRDCEAGADVLLTNTFNANRSLLVLHGRGRDQARIHRNAVALARDAGDGFVLGTIGPGAGRASVDSAVEQAEFLMEAGVDGLLLETHAFPEALRRIKEIAHRFNTVGVVSLYSWPADLGETSKQLLESGADVVGVNCGLGPASSVATTDQFLRISKAPWMVKPSAGGPGAGIVSPEAFGAMAGPMVLAGARMIGACCGGTEAHVASIRRSVDHVLNRVQNDVHS